MSSGTPGAGSPSPPDIATGHARRLRGARPSSYRPPAVPPYAVVRGRLSFLLDVAAHQRLTIVVAPTGYGKTLLLSQWAGTRRGHRIRWLTLDPSDNDVRRLMGRVRQALDPEQGSAVDPADFAVDRPRLTPVPAVDAELMARIERMPPTTLVLDDFHELSDPAGLEQLATLVEHAPRTLRTVISTQSDPPSRFYHLSLDDSLVELRQRDLAFRSEEAAALIGSLSDTVVDPEYVDRLVELTEGWPVGLHLAALSLRDQDDVAGFVETFSDDDRNVAEYLTQNVLARLPEPIRDFLLRTSVLDRMNASLCDALTGRTDSQAVLEDLVRRSIFISPVEPGSRWFRYHHLFRIAMRRYLRAQGTALDYGLLRTAAAWHIGRRDMETGLRYLAEAEAWEDLYDTISRFGNEILALNGAAMAASLISGSPAGTSGKYRYALLLEAGGWAINGSVGRACAVLDAVDSLTGATGGERAVATLIRSFCDLRDGRAAAAADGAEQALALVDGSPTGGSPDARRVPDVFGLTGDPSEVSAAAAVVGGTGMLHEGRTEDARRMLGRGAGAVHPVWQVAALGALAMAECWAGRLSLAEQLGRRSLLIAERSGYGHLVSPAAYIALAGVARERDRLDEAESWLVEADRSLAANGDRVAASLAIVERSLLALAEGRPTVGLAALKSHRPGAQHPLPAGIVARWRTAEAELLMVSGERDAAAQALQLSPLRTSEVVAAEVLLAVDRGDLARARALASNWPSEPAPRAALERELVVAVLEHLDGHADPARRRLAEVVEACSYEGWVGLLRRPHVVSAARGLYREAPDPFLRRVCEYPAGPVSHRRVRGMVEQLTEREYMLLPLLPTRLTNVEMAANLGVSLNTVKTHLKHIYRKLGVTERAEAIAAAEELHLW